MKTRVLMAVAPAAIIGDTTAENILGKMPPIGKKISIRGRWFAV